MKVAREAHPARVGAAHIRCIQAACVLFFLLFLNSAARAQSPQLVVAIHDSELTRSLDSSNSPATGPTPTGAGTTGLQWWIPDWHYFVMPEALKEAFRSDGTPFTVVGDSNITAGVLLTNGAPKYPIMISLASEAIRDDEIGPLTNYVAAGGFLFIGSSAFTRTTNGASRNDFAFANELGIHTVNPGLTNWWGNRNFTKQTDHRLLSHVPTGQLTWRMPTTAEEINWGVSPAHPYLAPHDVWKVASSNATVLAQGDTYPYLIVKQFGKGWFIYYAGMQPLVAHSGFQPGMYCYMIFRKAIEWAFESLNAPVARLGAWPYQYDAAFMVRHDLENFTNLIANISPSAQMEFTNGARGDYYFCTGTLRDDASPTFNTNTIIAGLRTAVTNYGALIGSHNGGLKNINNTNLVRGEYDYWHWGLDEVLDLSPTNYANGKAYALASLSNSFNDVEGWLTGLTNGLRSWVGCYFNATREDSYDIQSQLHVNIAGDQKITCFPHWTLSTRTPGKLYNFVSQPVSEWFVGGLIAQSIEPWHPPGVHTISSLRDGIDFYYGIGGLINFYSHSLSTGAGDAGYLAQDYLTYGVNSSMHPKLWSTNAVGVYYWWIQRSNAQASVTYSTNGLQSITKVAVAGASNANTTLEVFVPGSGSAYGLQVLTNNVLDAGAGSYRLNGQTIKVRVGATVTNAEVRYILGPRAQNDAYTATNGLTLTVPAPGVLTNDSAGVGSNLVALLISSPTNGTLVLNSNGGFTYTPAANAVGADMFTYQASDGGSNASTANVTIALASPDTQFEDSFIRATEPGLLTPWIALSNTWTVTSGILRGSPNILNNYGFAYITNSASNYSVQARIQFATNAYGGGLGARLDPITGAHYAAWIYPEGSAGGSLLLRLVKFRTWSSFGYAPSGNNFMGQVSLPSVGTNWHTVKLALYGTRVAVYFDGKQMLSVTDTEGSPGPYLSGAVSADMWTGPTPFNMLLDDVAMTPLAPTDAYTVNEDGQLVVPAPGVLSNDVPVFGTNLTAVLVTGPTNGSLTLSTNGGFTYTPSTNFNGTDTFIYSANDGQTNLGNAAVTITVVPVNDGPSLAAQANRTINEMTLLTVTNTASDVDGVLQTLTYQLIPPSPIGATVNSNGVLTWTPSEAQGPGNYTLTTVVTDNGTPPLSATNSFSVTVNESNQPPVLPNPPNRTINELVLLTVTNTATDADLPVNPLGYLLLAAPAGATINSNGIITWTPTEGQGPSTNTFTTVVTDTNVAAINSQNLSATNSFIVVVNESNTPPVLSPQANRTILPLSSLLVTNTATDSDVPANTLTYSLLVAPTNAAVDANGVITWTPLQSQNLTTNTITTVVTDFNPAAVNSQHLSATNSFVVVVDDRPALNLASAALVAEGCVPTNSAVDPGETVTLGFSLQNTGLGNTTNLVVTLLATNGVLSPSGPVSYGVITAGGAAVSKSFSFTANGSCGATISPTLQLQDGAANLGLVATSLGLGPLTTNFAENFDGVTAPALPAGWTTSTSNAQPVWVTQTSVRDTLPNAAFSADAGNVGVNELVSPAFTLAVSQPKLTFRHNYDLEGGGLNVAYDGGVLDIKVGTNAFADILAAGGTFQTNGYNRIVDTNYSNPLAGRQVWSGTSGGFLTTIVNLPSSAVGKTIQLRWRCGTDNGNPLTGWRVDTILLTGSACCLNTPPVLAAQSERTIAELGSLIVTNTASDPGIPANTVTYSLLGPPAGATINSNGVITWTPDETQGPATNAIITVAMNSGVPSLAATNSFTVVVNEINQAPILPVQTNRTTIGLTPVTITNTATDADLPANSLAYVLASGPSNAVIDTNGIISWTPVVAQVPSSNFFTTIVTDNNPAAVNAPQMSATNSFAVIVNAIHNGPTLPVRTNRAINELTLLSVNNTAADSDIPPLQLTYQLLGAPAGASVNSNGIITWTPDESQGPGTNTITTVVTDNGLPALSATNSFIVTVNELNQPPILPVQADRTNNGLASLTVTNTATDADTPADPLTYQLVAGPTNASIDPNGIISWTPVVTQVPSSNFFTTIVMDNNSAAVNAQQMSATNSFSVLVNAIHNGPTLPVRTNRAINELTLLSVTNTATANDIPPLQLTYQLVNPPPGASVSTNGLITWTPDESQGPGTNTITTVVTDNGSPPLSATNSFIVTVNEVNQPPSLPSQPNRTISGLTSLTVTNTATDADVPANPLTYQLATGPTNAVIDTNGIITWTPVPAQVPSTNIFNTLVTDSNPAAINAQQMTSANTFTVVVNAVHDGPSLPDQTNRTIMELTLLTLTNTAADNDIPALQLTYQLINPPLGASISSNGIINWTPDESQGPGTNTITTVVTDSGSTPLSATNVFTVVVNESNQAPVLPIQTNSTITGMVSLSITNTATDADLPANALAYLLASSPTNALIDTNGVITWTPVAEQVPSTNVFTTIATDNNPWAINAQQLRATNTFIVCLKAPAAGPPLIQSINVVSGIVTISWSSVLGHTYRLQYKDALMEPNWSNQPPDVHAASDSSSATNDPGTTALRLYRVQLVE